MDEIRSVKISVVLTPSLAARLDVYRERHRWSRSTATAILIEDGLARDEEKRGKDHENHQEAPGRSRHTRDGTLRGSSDRAGEPSPT
jgi:hypothetical protein